MPGGIAQTGDNRSRDARKAFRVVTPAEFEFEFEFELENRLGWFAAIRRAGYAGFRRTVAVVLGNWLAEVEDPREEAVDPLREALRLVREHARWALERLRWA
jgi:epoxyqueuosine reductase QueG